MESDEQLRSFLLASTGTMAVPFANKLYAEKLVKPHWDLKPSERKQFKDLVNKIEKSGIEFLPNSKVGPAFDPFDNKIFLPEKTTTPGVLAHEWGHALNSATLKKLGGKPLHHTWSALYGLAHPLNALSTTAALTAVGSGASEDTLRNIGLAGTAAQTPRLIEEIVASARGAAKLKKLNMPGKLKAFIGIPTYIAPMTLPMMPWLAKKLDPTLQKLLNKKEGE